MRQIIIVAGVAVLVIGAVIISRNMKSQNVGTSNTIAPKTTKIAKKDKLKYSMDVNRGGTAGRKMVVAQAKLDPNKEVSPDGRIWTITYVKRTKGGKGYYEVAGNQFSSRKKAKQWVRNIG